MNRSLSSDLSDKELQDISRQMIAKGSKSFSLASLVFGGEVRRASHLLYNWCRYCDDFIDQACPWELGDRVDYLKTELNRSLREGDTDNPHFLALQKIVKAYKIPFHYPAEMIEGMRMDAIGYKYQNLGDLELYCYRVASTVGLMMCHIMGVSDERALKHASDMGMAMQMTNIARDIVEDHRMGRLYLPSIWLEGAGVSAENLLEKSSRPHVQKAVLRLLDLADEYYLSADQGLPYLNFRTRWAVYSARLIYSRIGEKLRRRQARFWQGRVYTGKLEKLWLLAKGLWDLVFLRPRSRSPWRAVPIQTVKRLG